MNEMNKFEIGDRVRVERVDKEGVVVDYYCDNIVGDHQVLVRFDGDRIALGYGEESVTYIGEDKYEYAVRLTKKGTGETLPDRLVWMTKSEAQKDIDLLGGSSKFYNYKMVKRRKAGPVEEV